MQKTFETTGTPAYSEFIYKSRYARWLTEENRREDWSETVDRYVSFFCERFPDHEEEIRKLGTHIESFEVMPSMRALQTAGTALEVTHTAGYNCAYLPVDHPRSFDEAMYISMCGTGVGFSVERQFVSKMPEVAEELFPTETIITVRDSRIGWASGLKELISLLYNGQIPDWDLSKLRPEGARLKTFGGRSSGPVPLDELFHYTVNLFKTAAGRKLSSLECHDLMCKIGEVVVVGGVRRSAMLSLSNPSDDRMRGAKSGQWFTTNKERRLANNSACYTERPELLTFLHEWSSLYESKSGERGIFSRVAADNKVKTIGRREPGHDWGCNPCSEIILRPHQFCNLSEVILRPTDDLVAVKRKVKVATIFGTLQATLTNFKYLRKRWSDNCKEEALLGVSMTGIQDHPVLGDPDHPEIHEWLRELKEHTIKVNKKWAKRLGINQAAAITTVKPSGTVSQLTNTSSGIHPRFNDYYIRRVRIDIKDPVYSFLHMQGVPCELDKFNSNVAVFDYPIKSPEGAKTAPDVGAMHQLKLWKLYQDYWCEHKPSCTVYYTDKEFLRVGAWIWENFDSVSGISFYPRLDNVYQQAPYEAVDEATYKEAVTKMPQVDWKQLELYEKEDSTKGSHTLACSGGSCEIVDLTDDESDITS